MIISEIERRDIAACAEILMSVYNNELWQCRWEKKTACAYLTDAANYCKITNFRLL